MLTKDKLQQFRTAFEEAAKEIHDKTGIEVKLGSINYSENDFTVKLTGYEGQAPNEEEMYADAWRAYARSLGLEDLEVGSHFVFKGKTYRIIGLMLSSKAYPVVAVRSDNHQQYRFPVSKIKEVCGLNFRDRYTREGTVC